jgi:hypothetical protein
MNDTELCMAICGFVDGKQFRDVVFLGKRFDLASDSFEMKFGRPANLVTVGTIGDYALALTKLATEIEARYDVKVQTNQDHLLAIVPSAPTSRKRLVYFLTFCTLATVLFAFVGRLVHYFSMPAWLTCITLALAAWLNYLFSNNVLGLQKAQA